MVILAIVFISILPAVFEYLKHRSELRRGAPDLPTLPELTRRADGC